MWTVDGLSYTTRIKLTIDNTKVDSTLSDFPVLVKLTSSELDFAKANADGFDIRFTQSDGSTLLKYERERHDNGNSLAEYWVKIPSISSSADTDFYMYYRTTDTADGADPTNVWDANYKAVWHLKNKTTSTIEDSTSNNDDGTKVGAGEPAEADAKIGKGQLFDGDNDEISTTNNCPAGNFTIEAWCKNTTSSEAGWDAFYGAGLELSGFISKQDEPSSDSYRLRFHIGGAANYIQSDEGITTLNVWEHYVATWNGSSGQLYLNGSPITTNVIGTPANPTATAVILGDREDGNPWQGYIDEVRVSDSARTAAWLKASYNSGNDSLLTYGGEERILTATVGTFVLTGIAALLLRGYTIVCAVGSFALTGINVILTKGYGIICEVGEFILTGINVGLLRPIINMAVTVGEFALTGVNVVLGRAITMAVSVGQFILTGIDIIFSGKWWKYKTKHTATWTGETKHTASWTKQSKSETSPTWKYQDKH